MKIILTTLMLALASTAQAGVKQYGNWKLHNSVDQLTGERELYMWASATTKDSQYGKKPFMGIDCESMYFGRLDVLSGGSVTFRTNTMAKAATKRGDKWEGLNGTTIDFPVYNKRQTNKFWSNYKQHFKNSISGTTMIARFNSYSRHDQTIKVPLNGFTPAITALAKECSKP